MITVLYVDDEEMLLDIGKQFLERLGGFEVTLQDSAIRALSLLETRQFDVIVSDYQMPDMDGIAFLQAVREKYGQTPFILFTGKGREEVVIRALNSGADFYLQKGGDPKSQYTELIHKIRLSVQRQETEKALAESERRYRDVVETQSEFIVRVRPDGAMAFVNGAYCRYLGKSRDELIGQTFTPGFPGEGREQIDSHILSLTLDHPVAEIENRFIMPDGSVRWHRWKNRALFDGDGTIREYQLTGADITVQKQAQEALQESEEKFRALAESAPAGIAVVQDNTDVYVNDYITLMTGYSREEIYKHNFWDFFHPDHRDLIKKRALARMQGADTLTRYEIKYMTKAGITRWADLSADVIRYRGRPALVAMLVDITNRKLAEEELQGANEELQAAHEELHAQLIELRSQQERLSESELNYRNILKNIQDMYYRTDPGGNLILASPSIATVLGYENLSDLYGKNIADTLYLDPEKRKDLLVEIERMGFVTDYEVVLKKKDGSPVYTVANSHVYYTPSGERAGIEGIMHDITGRKNMEDAIRASESLYRSVFDNTGAGTIIIGSDTTILLANASWEKLTGTPRKEQENKRKWTEFVDPADLDRMVQYHYARRKDPSSAPKMYECRITDVSGKKHQCVIYVDMIPLSANSVASLIDITSLKEAESALAESEKKYRSIIEQMQDAYYRTDMDGYLQMVNPAFVKEFGYHSSEELLGKPILEITSANPADREVFIKKLIQEGIVSEFRVAMKRGDGMSGTYSASSHLLYDPDNNPVGVEGILHDITDHLRVEEALAEIEIKYHELSELLPQMVFELDPDYRITYANRYALDSLGYTPGDINDGMNFFSIIDPDHHSHLRDAIDHPSLGNSGTHEFVTKKKDGGTIPALVYITPVFQVHVVTGYCGVMIDISERKQIYLALQESEKLFREVFNNASDEIIVHEISEETGPGPFILVNDTICERMGYSRDELMKLSIPDIISQDITPPVLNTTRLLFSGEKVMFESTHVRKDGTIYPIEVSSRLFTLGNRPVIMSISRDISERKRAEEALKQANRKLNILSSITRHDLLNQLNALILYLNLSKKRVIEDTLGLEYLEKELEIAGIMDHLIGFTRSYQDIGIKKPEWTNVDRLVRQAASLLITAGITLEVSLAGLLIYADRLVEKVFYNLVENSIRHGGHVTLISVNYYRNDSGVIIEYRDNGAGVVPEHKKEIFSKGFGTNTGWGMFLSREILSITHITIRETGVFGEGARFEILAPDGSWKIVSPSS